jgi:hypothetical protein
MLRRLWRYVLSFALAGFIGRRRTVVCMFISPRFLLVLRVVLRSYSRFARGYQCEKSQNGLTSAHS